MYLHRTTVAGLFAGLIVSGACTAAPDSGSTTTKEDSGLRQTESQEMVEVKVRMPDGRVIVRKERKNPSRIDPNHPIVTGDRPAIATGKSPRSTGGQVNTTKPGASGGSSGASGALSKGGSGAGGGMGGGGSSAGGAFRGAHGGGDSVAPGDEDSSGGSDDTFTDGTPSDNENALLLDEDRTVWIYAWRNSGDPFQYVTNNYVAYPVNKTAEQLATEIADKIRTDNPSRIAIRLFHEFDPADRHPFDISDPIDVVSRGGYTDGLFDYWRTFAEHLKDQGITPDLFILDMEEGFVLGRLPEDGREHFVRELIGSSGDLHPDFPTSIRSVTYDEFMDYRREPGRSARNEYLRFAVAFRAKFLKRVFSDTFNAVWGHHIPISNYSEVDSSFPLTEYNSRPIPDVTMAGVSAPISYLHRVPDWGRYYHARKDIRWNRLIDVLNRNRSAAASGAVTPWVAAPGYGIRGHNTWAMPHELDEEMRVWEILMEHLVATGIDNIILWNPIERYNINAVECERLVDQWLANNPYAPVQLDPYLPEIPLDAGYIETNGVVTTYSEFLAAMNGVHAE